MFFPATSIGASFRRKRESRDLPHSSSASHEIISEQDNGDFDMTYMEISDIQNTDGNVEMQMEEHDDRLIVIDHVHGNHELNVIQIENHDAINHDYCLETAV